MTNIVSHYSTGKNRAMPNIVFKSFTKDRRMLSHIAQHIEQGQTILADQLQDYIQTLFINEDAAYINIYQSLDKFAVPCLTVTRPCPHTK